MRSTVAIRARRSVLASAVGLLTLVLSAGTALAETEVGHTGLVGDHQLNESSGNRIVTCRYANSDLGGYLKAFEIRTPTIWARDLNANVNSQNVGWQVIVQRKKPGGSWKSFYKSSILKAMASDNVSAFFATRTIDESMVLFPSTGMYRIRSKMFWYRNGSVEGTANHQYDYYETFEEQTAGPIDIAGKCPGRVFA
jgi:hypothetical protein